MAIFSITYFKYMGNKMSQMGNPCTLHAINASNAAETDAKNHEHDEKSFGSQEWTTNFHSSFTIGLYWMKYIPFMLYYIYSLFIEFLKDHAVESYDDANNLCTCLWERWVVQSHRSQVGGMIPSNIMLKLWIKLAKTFPLLTLINWQVKLSVVISYRRKSLGNHN